MTEIRFLKSQAELAAMAERLERENAALRADATRWRALMRAGVTYYNTAESAAPVLASVSKRIFYHATDDTESCTLAEAMDRYEREHP